MPSGMRKDSPVPGTLMWVGLVVRVDLVATTITGIDQQTSGMNLVA
jgi:hypothetical protein